MTERSYATLTDGVVPVDQLPQTVAQLPPPLVEDLATQEELDDHAAGPHGGVHPDLATHTALGLSPAHAHPYEAAGAVSTHAGTPHGTQPHAVSGVSHTGTLDHSALSNQTANQHHAQAHAVSGADHTGTLAIGQIPTGQTGSTVPFGNDARFSDARSPLAHVHVDGDLPATIARDTEVTAAVSAHAALADPHAVYATDTDLTTHAATPHGGPTIVKLTSNQVSAVTTFADITGFTRALAASAYCYFKCVVVYRANAITTGIRLGVNGPASPAVLAYRVSSSRTNALMNAAGATDNEATFVAQGYDTPAADTGVAAVSTDYIATIEGVIQNGANAGTLAMRFASEVAIANGITLRPGSHVMFWSI